MLRLLVTLALTLAGATSASFAGDVARQQRALLIGINSYPWFQDLDGPTNDVARIKELLKEKFGFEESGITTLLDAQATREGILRELKQVVEATRTSDVLFVFFSGHGGQVADVDGDEKDRDAMDETIVPHDGRKPGVIDIVDDEIANIVGALKTEHAVFVFDSCHSGTASKSSRSDVRTKRAPVDHRQHLYKSIARKATQGKGVEELAEKYVLIAAARDWQEGMTGPFDPTRGRQHWNGLLTYCLCEAYSKISPASTILELEREVARQLKIVEARRDPVLPWVPEPMLEAAKQRQLRPLFPPKAKGVARVRGLTVLSHEGRKARLAAGDRSLSPGSLWALYPPGETEFLPAHAVATGVLEAGSRNQLQVQSSRRAQLAGCTAVQFATSAPSAAWSFFVDPSPPMDPEKLGALKRMIQRAVPGVLFRESPADARFVVRRGVVGKSDQPTGFEIYDSASQCIVEHLPDPGPDLAGELQEFTNRFSFAEQVLALDNPSSRVAIVARTLGGVEEAGSIHGKGSRLRPVVEHATHRIRREGAPRTLENSMVVEVEVSEDCYLTIVAVDMEGLVQVHFPNRYSESKRYYSQGLVPAGTPVRIPDSPDGVKAGFTIEYTDPPGIDTIKIFASPELSTMEAIRAFLRGEPADFPDRRREFVRTLGKGSRLKPVVADTPEERDRGFQGVFDWTTTTLTVKVEH